MPRELNYISDWDKCEILLNCLKKSANNIIFVKFYEKCWKRVCFFNRLGFVLKKRCLISGFLYFERITSLSMMSIVHSELYRKWSLRTFWKPKKLPQCQYSQRNNMYRNLNNRKVRLKSGLNFLWDYNFVQLFGFINISTIFYESEEISALTTR